VLENVVGQLYPAVSFQQGYSRVKVNFGLKENSVQFKFEPEGGLRVIEIVTRLVPRRSRTRDDSLDREVIYHHRRSDYDRPGEVIYYGRPREDIYESRSVASYDRRDRRSEDIYESRSVTGYERRDRDRDYDRRDRDGDYDRRSDDRRREVIYERPKRD